MVKSPPAAFTFKRSPQASALLERARLALDDNRLDETEALATQALQINSLDCDAIHLIANAYLQRKNFTKAEELVRACISMSSKNPLYYLTYGVILLEQGRVDEALVMQHKALSFNAPDILHYIYGGIGTCLYHKRELEEAIEYFSKAIAVKPDFSLAYFNRGSAYYSLGGEHSKEMSADFERAAELDPGNALLFQKMTVIYHEMRDYLQAINLLRRAITLRPDLEDAWILLAHSYHKVGNTATALSIYEHLAEKYPNNPCIRMEPAYMFPIIAESNEDIIRWRDRFMRNLDKLIEENFTVRDPEWRVLNLPFYQGYHGQNNLQLMKKMAEFFLHACPALNFTAPHCTKPRQKKDKIRIGFVSEMYHSDLINQFYSPLLEAFMQHKGFEVVLIANSGRKNESVEKLIASARYIMLPTHLGLAQQAVTAEKLDMLIYLDIGMNVMNYMLAFARLAPIQLVMGGHPITTGIPNMDYFITSRTIEPANAHEHYSEKLLMLEKSISVFRRKQVPIDSRTRKELGLPEEARLYACPVMLYKLHPDMDKVFAEILARDEKAIIILFDSKYKTIWRATLQKRFALSMPAEHVARIHFLPHANGEYFYYYLKVMDCVLDTFHFSFGTTAFLTLGADIPYVTLQGEFQRGRAGTMLYQQMGVTDLIAESPAHFVELALKLAQDKPFHQRMVEAIRAKSDCIFDDYSVIEPFITSLRELYLSTAS